jgi:hypothetical protein
MGGVSKEGGVTLIDNPCFSLIILTELEHSTSGHCLPSGMCYTARSISYVHPRLEHLGINDYELALGRALVSHPPNAVKIHFQSN